MAKPEKTRSKAFTRRAALLLGGKMLVLGGLAGRLYYLQVVEADRYRMLAEENRLNLRLLPPPRGFIIDRNGDYLAINVQNYRVLLVPEQAQNADGVAATLEKLRALIDLEQDDIDRVLREAGRRRAFVPIKVRENLSWAEVSRLGVNQPELAGVHIDVGQTRHYPYGNHMAHVLGYVAAVSAKEWQELVTNPYGPLTNKAIAGQYSPGSTFKMVVALAALEQGITPDYSVYCPGHMQLGNRRFHCWKRYGHGHMDMVGSLRESCDVYFYDVARRVGVDNIAKMARKLGLGDQTGIDLVGEKSGLIPTRDWKRSQLGQPWHMGETLVIGIGQGYVLTTPLQLAVMASRLSNGGHAVVPHLTTHRFDGENLQPRSDEPAPSMGIPERHLAIVRQGMDEVVNHSRGTARASALDLGGYEMGGKTGTSQVRRISKAERETGIRKGEDITWRLRDHALFVGFAPVHDPIYAVSVVVEHGGGGSTAAAPIASDVLEKILKLDGLVSAETAEGEPSGGGAG